MTFANQKGTVLTFVITGIGLIVALSAGAFYLTSTSTFSGLSANDQNQAYHLAKAGIEYALVNNRAKASTFTLKEGKFSLTFSDDKIESTGIVKEGTPYEVKRKIVVEQTGFGSRPDISFEKNIADFKPETGKVRESKTGFVDTTSPSQISLGQQKTSAFGAVWYRGNSANGNCLDGKCDFGGGFTVFFVFKMEKSSSYGLGDGFTFAIFNGEDNDLYSVGGYGGRGELMGYAGSSYVITSGLYLDNNRGNGIRPPKIAVEFDPFPNAGTGEACIDGNRKDASSGNHMAYVFWGDNSTTPCTFTGSGTTAGKISFDDNQHQAGDNAVDEPQNSISTDAKSYFTGSSSNWLERTYPYAFRIEIRRSDAGSGNYDYELKSWIKECSNDACTEHSEGTFGNTKVAYTATPTIRRTIVDGNQIVLNTYHTKFNKFLFGWTAATGSATQNTVLKDFKIYFVK